MFCHFCKKEVVLTGSVGRRDDCESCGGDLHICYNCAHYDATAYNECHEPQAERVVEKDKSNFCDYFTPSTAGAIGASNEVEDAKKKLEELFKK